MMGFISTKMSCHVQVLHQPLFWNVFCPFHFHEKSCKALTSLVTVLCGVYTQVSIISKHLCPVWMEEWVSLMTDRSTLVFKGELYSFLSCPYLVSMIQVVLSKMKFLLAPAWPREVSFRVFPGSHWGLNLPYPLSCSCRPGNSSLS